MPEPSHVAVVLAAGGSWRLGRPKQLLTRDGETLLHRVVRLVRDTAPRRLLVVIGAHADAMRDALQDQPCDWLENPEWDEGLASSLRRVAAQFADERGPVLIVGCDQPALDIDILQRLLEGARVAPSGCAAIDYGDALGMPVVIRGELLREAHALQGDRGLRALFTTSPSGSISAVLLQNPLLDIDTPDDLAVAIAARWLDAQ